MSIAKRVEQLDHSLFDEIKVGGTTPEDRRSLLALHSALAERGQFTYLEVGCYLGGSLQALVADPRCERVVAIDAREKIPSDVRSHKPVYLNNTTAQMLEELAHVSEADLAKVQTVDASTDGLDPRAYGADLCFIDAEHTNAAALRDARFCRKVIRDQGVIVFHDRTLVVDAIRAWLSQLPTYRAYPLINDLFVVELGVPTLLSHPNVRQRVPRRVWLIADRLRLTAAALALSGRHNRGLAS
jgi:Methyltransferase domain